MQSSLQHMFEEFLNKKSLFANKEALTIRYNPSEILHRDQQISLLAQILAPSLRNEKPSNILIYGKTGTGKTVVTRHVCSQLEIMAKSKSIPLDVIYVNCKLNMVADTEYRLFTHLASMFGKKLPATGLPTNKVYNEFFKKLDEKKRIAVIILDEIDTLVKKQGSDVLYTLTRINSELKNAKITFIGISNDVTFTDSLDPRVKSGLSEEKIIFPTYDAIQLKDILHKRAKMAFVIGVVDDFALSKCAAMAAREHGDARKALDLLRVAGELAERESAMKIEEKHIDMADKKIENDKVIELLRNLAKQDLLVFYSVLTVSKTKNRALSTGEVYDIYKGLCVSADMKSLTQRRVSDILDELDMLGLINANVISKGRYGRSREINISLSEQLKSKAEQVLKEVFEI